MPDNALGTAADSPYYVLDTCTLLDGFDETLPADRVVVLIHVIDELDAQKDRGGEVGFNARVALKRIFARGYLIREAPRLFHAADTADSAVAQGRFLEGDTTLQGIPVSSDIGVLVRSRLAGRDALNHRALLDAPEPLSVMRTDPKAVYTDVLVDSEFLDALYAQGSLDCTAPAGISRARFVSPKGTALAWLSDGAAYLVDPKVGASGVSARDAAQAFALDALLDEEASLVCLTGQAGTGKTYLTLAASLALQEGGDYGTLYAVRPVVPLGRDIGYLPGTKDEKMAPWAQVVWDTAEAIRPSLTMDQLVGKNQRYDIRIEPATYMRGRSIPGAILWIDEAQNMDIHELKTLLTRAGQGTKVVLTGDVAQVDRKDINTKTNGLIRVIQQFEGWEGFRYVNLTKNLRSPLAEAAANRLG